MSQPELIEAATPAEILQHARREILSLRVLVSRDYRVNPGGLIHYVSLDRDALMARAALDGETYASPVSAPVVEHIRRDPVTGFWSGSLKWHSSE